jgi:large subunit ribosomal protein L22
LVRAKSNYIRMSPFKLRLIVDVIRGFPVNKALAFLKTCALKRVQPIEKTLLSAYANGKSAGFDNSSMGEVFIKEIKVNPGPMIRYYKPAAMGRACGQTKRMCHLEVVLEKKVK